MSYAPASMYCALLLMTLYSSLSLAFDNAHFYRAPYLGPEPRLEYPWLASLEISIAGGSARHGKNSQGQKVPLLDIYGISNMQDLGKGVPSRDINNLNDLILVTLERLPHRETFGQESILGQFDIAEGTFLYTQNLNKGFFIQLYVPFRSMDISAIQFTDLSPESDLIPNKATPEWEAFLNNFNNIISYYGLNIQDTNERGIGDTTLLLGWTINYDDTCWLDYVDGTLKLGILFPTGKKRDENQVFSLPLGYNGHAGFPFSGTLSFGLYEWLTLGIFGEGIVFNTRITQLRMKTAFEQSGPIKLALGNALVKAGTLWFVGGFAKADHFCHGLSLILGGSYAQKNRDIITPRDSCFNSAIVNSDQQYQRWNRTTFHIIGEWDLTKESMRWGSRVALFYNRSLSGKRIFSTSMAGNYLGFEFALSF